MITTTVLPATLAKPLTVTIVRSGGGDTVCTLVVASGNLRLHTGPTLVSVQGHWQCDRPLTDLHPHGIATPDRGLFRIDADTVKEVEVLDPKSVRISLW